MPTFTGTSGNDTLIGTAAADIFVGQGGNDRIDGRQGNDYAEGGTGNEVYVFGRGYGQDRVFDVQFVGLSSDAIEFLAGITRDDLIFSRFGNDLVIEIRGTTDRLTIRDQFHVDASGFQAFQIEQFRFADTTVMTAADVRAIFTTGGPGNDTLIGFGTPDVIAGHGGDDRMTGGAGNDLIYGHAGSDTAIYSGPQANYTITFNPDGSVTIADNRGAGFDGVDTLYGVEFAQFSNGTIALPGQHQAPVAVSESYSLDEDGALSVAAPGVLANDTDADGDDLDAVLVAGPAHGTLTLDAETGSFVYTPTADYFGADHFTYLATDGSETSDIVTVTLAVSAVNDAPVAVDDAYATDEDTPLVVPAAAGVLLNDGDVDGDPLGTALIGGPAHGTLEFDAATGAFVYTPDADYNGADQFTYEVTDGQGATAAATVHLAVHAVNDAPVAAPDSFATQEDVAIAGNVLVNDTDVDAGDALIVTAGTFATVQGGQVTIAADGSFEYTPPADHASSDSFTYTLSDAAGASATGTVTIGLAPVADEPALAVLNAGGRPKQLIPLTVAAASTDGDGSETLSLFIDGIPAGVTVGDGTNSFTATKTGTTADISGWDLDTLSLLYPKSGHADFTLTVRAVTEEGGTSASATQSLEVSISSAAVVPIIGTPGDDAIDMSGRSAKYVILGHHGDDVIKGGRGADLILGGAGDDWLGGNEGGDRIYGDRGNDLVYGHAGNDRLAGGKGDDLLVGGEGHDRLAGNQGADTYVFKLGDGHDTIDNRWGSGDGDRLVFGDGIALADLSVARDGDDLVIELLGSDDSVTIDDWFGCGGNQIDHVEVAGVVLSAAALEALIPPMPVVPLV